MRILLFLFMFSGIYFQGFCYAQPFSPPGIMTTEEDGDPNTRCLKYKFANGNVTKNGDGTCSIADQSGAGGGDPILIDTVAVTDASGVDIQGGAGVAITFNAAVSPDTAIIATASSEVAFLASGALTCGAGTAGKMQIHTTPLQYCDNAATPALQYAAYGSSTGVATSTTSDSTWTSHNSYPAACAASNWMTTIGDTVTCSQPAFTDISGAVTDAQVPNTITVDLATTATTANAGDSATSFFSSGTLEVAIGGTGTTTSTGTGAVVLGTSPTLITPVLGVASGTSLDLSGTIGVGGAASGTFGVEVQGATISLGGAQFTHTGASGASSGAGFLVGSNDGATVITGDRLGWIAFLGHDGTNYDTTGTGGAIISHARETWTNTSHAGSLSLYSNPTTSTTLAERIRINPTGTVNIIQPLSIGSTAGTTPAATLDAIALDNGIVSQMKINATQANVTTLDTFIDFRSTTGSEGSVAGTAVAGVIAYNTFTGSHYTQVIDKTGLGVNMLLEIVDDIAPVFSKVISTETKLVEREVKDEKGNVVMEEKKDFMGEIEKDTLGNIVFIPKTEMVEVPIEYEASQKNQLFKTRISQTKGSKAAVGVYGGTDKEGRDLALSIGTGFIWVVNKGKDIAIGDFLIASDVKGMAESQIDDVYRNNTVAKATQMVVWVKDEVSRLIKCVYLGG